MTTTILHRVLAALVVAVVGAEMLVRGRVGR